MTRASRRRLEQWQEGDTALGVRLWSSWVWRFLAPVVALVLLVAVSLGIGPAWSARDTDAGVRGVVIVTGKDCSRNSCSFVGDFASDDGTVRRYGVGLASGFSSPTVGEAQEAYDIDAGSPVYPKGGGNDWIYTSLLLVASVIVLGLWCLTVPPRWWRRRNYAKTERG